MNTIKAITATAIHDDKQGWAGGQRADAELPHWMASATAIPRRCRQNISEIPLPITARGESVAEPHRNMVAAGQSDRGGEAEKHAGSMTTLAVAFEPDRDAVGLERGQDHREIKGIRFRSWRPASLPSSALRAAANTVVTTKLDDDRGRNIRPDVQPKIALR